MIDIHTHILPCLDDGAADFETSMEMLDMAVKDGTDTIVVTPHVIPGSLHSSTENINKIYEDIKKMAAEKYPSLEILKGSEVFICPELPKLLREGCIPTLNNTSYILVEFPMMSIPPYADSVFYELQLRGYHPIIAHPERNRNIIADPNIIYDFVMKGMLTQINSTSLTGLYGSKVKETAIKLLKNNMVHFVASDTHTCNGRSPKLSGARKIVETEMGNSWAIKLFEQNAYTMLKNEEFEVPEPSLIKKTGNKMLFSLDIWRKLVLKAKT